MTDTENTQSNGAFNYPPLPKPEGRFNNWGERKWITVSEDKLETVNRELIQLNLTPRAQALYKAARFTDSEGIEFVFISNAQFPAPVIFQGTGVHIVPCFVPLRLIPGGPSPSEDRQAAMMKRGQFIYDGWIPNKDWTAAHIEQIVSMLDDLVNVFSIVGEYYALWQPKYYSEKTPISSYLIFENEFASLA